MSSVKQKIFHEQISETCIFTGLIIYKMTAYCCTETLGVFGCYILRLLKMDSDDIKGF